MYFFVIQNATYSFWLWSIAICRGFIPIVLSFTFSTFWYDSGVASPLPDRLGLTFDPDSCVCLPFVHPFSVSRINWVSNLQAHAFIFWRLMSLKLFVTARPHGKRLMGPKIYRSSRNRLSQGLLLCSIVSKS